MTRLRSFLRTHARLAALLLALALCMKALVPSGYMLGNAGSSGTTVLTVRLCTASLSAPSTRQIAIRQDGSVADDGAQDSAGHGKTGDTCPYAALTMASLAGADAVLLAAALLFILTLGFAPVIAPRIARVPHLRPPLRGPPLFS